MDGMISSNLTEDLVEIHIKGCIERADMCKCERCLADVRAYALNQLPPHYVVTDLGDAYVRVNAMSVQSQADILTAIMSGIKMVMQNPRHDPTKPTPKPEPTAEGE